MNWLFGRQEEPRRPSDPIVQPVQEEDSPAALAALRFQANRLINASAGQLPVAAVVAARRVTDVVDTVLYTTRDRDLDIHARVSINGILRDYLPTTLKAYLALDPSLRDRPRPNGITPTATPSSRSATSCAPNSVNRSSTFNGPSIAARRERRAHPGDPVAHRGG